MYLEYWQLAAKPFEPTLDRASFVSCDAQEGALLKLRYAVENRCGAALVAGPPGVGKTMLIQTMFRELADKFRPRVHLVFPQMTSRELLAYLADELGAPTTSSNAHALDESVRRIERTLHDSTNVGAVSLDEALRRLRIAAHGQVHQHLEFSAGVRRRIPRKFLPGRANMGAFLRIH